jgi:hypothetical protein
VPISLPEGAFSTGEWPLGLRLEQPPPGGRLERAASMGSNMVTVRIGLASVDDLDDEVEVWLAKAYVENA